MNNSKITNDFVEPEEVKDIKPQLRARETELIAIIRAIENLNANPDWKLLQDKIFNGVVLSLNKELMSEVKKQPLNGPKIHSLNGQIKWAEKYTNLSDLASIYKLELLNVRNNLNASN